MIAPGAVLGVLGSGQLGRMFTIAARRMGYRVHTFSPDSDTPTGQVADVEVVAPYADADALRAFAKHVTVVTFEFENVPSTATEVLESLVPVRPSPMALHLTQQRAREKRFLTSHGLPTVPFEVATTEAELSDALGRIEAHAWSGGIAGTARLASTGTLTLATGPRLELGWIDARGEGEHTEDGFRGSLRVSAWLDA